MRTIMIRRSLRPRSSLSRIQKPGCDLQPISIVPRGTIELCSWAMHIHELAVPNLHTDFHCPEGLMHAASAADIPGEPKDLTILLDSALSVW